MPTVDDFRFEVREIEHVWIAMRDGVRLSARIWLPVTDAPVPAILEYIPYGKRWGTRVRDEPMHRYFAGHGYAAIRLDVRGSGESEGLLADEYCEAEQQDCLEALRWIAAQNWCDGNVGMIGKSWGGFAAMQVAALQPPELKGVIAVCASDDRYTDDAHYMGGCLLTENLIWGAVLFTQAATPPDPQIVGQTWRRQWRERLENLPLYAEQWLRHPTRDEYWKQGSVSENYGRIQCPVLAVSGWADAYSNAVPRILAGLNCPRRGVIGPWAHVYPHDGAPGPTIGFLQEALAWFDHCLHGRGALPGPMLRAWLQEYVPPNEAGRTRPGRWVAESQWPSARIQSRVIDLGGSVRVATPLSVGQAAGAWCGFGAEGDTPTDQTGDDANSVCFDVPVVEAMDLLGAPVLRLRLSCDQPFGQLVVRLCDVGPAGSLRVTYGVLNLQHREGFEQVQPLVPGRDYDIRLTLNDCGHAFAPGHTLRVALSTSYWPIVRPERGRFALAVRKAEIVLPVRPPSSSDTTLPGFAAPARARGVQWLDQDAPLSSRELSREGMVHVHRFTIDAREDGGPAMSRLEPIDLEIGSTIAEEFRIVEGEPGSASLEVRHEVVLRRKGWDVHLRTEHRMSAEPDAYILRASVETWEHDIAVFSRLWEVRIPR